LDNAIRLLEDTRVLFGERSYLSCFLLSQLSLEELAKGFALIGKHLKKRAFSKVEWKNLTIGKKAHVSKLKYLQEVEDKWTEEVTRKLGPELSYHEVLKKTVKKLPWAKSVDEYRKKMSESYYNWRLDASYVEYNWKSKQWMEPLKHPVFDSIFIDEICMNTIKRAEFLSQVLRARLKRSEKVNEQNHNRTQTVLSINEGFP
jgi:AbiV family abortive infection protein